MHTRVESVAVVGAGAVGSYFGARLARAGHRVTLIGRPAHIRAIEESGLHLGLDGRTEVVPLHGSVRLDAVSEADLVLFCVKSPDTASVARDMAPHLREHAVVVSLQNGVENAPAIAKAVRQTVVPACVYVAVALPEPGVVAHYGRGDLVIGSPFNSEQAVSATRPAARLLQDIVDLFATAEIPVVISADVTRELWLKLVANCAYNAVSALAQARYGELVMLPEIRDVQRAAVREVVDVATADGVDLPLAAAFATMEQIAVSMAHQRSSTAQDMAKRKPSEIDHLNGFIVRRGRELGIATPVNQTLHALVKLVEAGYARV